MTALYRHAREVSSEEQKLLPLSTFVSPLMLTHTSGWARATPERAIIAAIIAVAANRTMMRFIGATIPLGGGGRKGVSDLRPVS